MSIRKLDVENTIPATAFFTKIYDETFQLLVQARDYLSEREPAETMHLTSSDRLLLTTLMMRLTAQLTDIMAWLLVQKAVHAGEMNKEDAESEKYRLLRWEGSKIQLNATIYIPKELQMMIDESQKIYERVARLEALLSHQEDR